MGQFGLEGPAVDYTEVLPCSSLTQKALKEGEKREEKPKLSLEIGSCLVQPGLKFAM